MKDYNAIEIKNLTKSFKLKIVSNGSKNIVSRFKGNQEEKIVLNDISLDIKKGEVIGILGRNGSGKSTLLKIISHILEPDSGSIEVNGRIASILELGMGFHPDMSGRENIYLKASMYGFSKKDIDSKLDNIIEYSGLGSYIDYPLRTYSSGMTGRLAFAIMINVDADVFLIDEILSVGDASFSAKASEHFKKAAKSGKTVLLVSHSINSIIEMCTRAIWIEEGKIKENGSVKIVCDHYRIAMTESFEIISDLAVSGVVEAQYRLALMYRDGNNIVSDPVLAFKWMKDAADQNYMPALLGCADMLFDGIGTDKDVISAIHYYQMAADRGNNDARMKLSMLVSNDDNEINEVRNLFKNLADRGNPSNQFRYGEFLLKIAWNESDRNEAFQWIKRASDMGNLDALFQLGIMYRDGIGIKSDIQNAINCFKNAAENGHLKSQITLAEILISGTKIERNESEAFKWYLLSARSGNLRAQYQVAVMYRDGIGTIINYEESKKWFNIFSKSNLINSKMVIAEILKTIKLDDIHSYESLMKDAADSFNSQAMYKLAIYYRDSLINFDKNKMIDLLQMSANCNNILAQVALGDMYLKGMYIDRNEELAFKYYLNAALNGNSGASYKIALMYKDGIGIEKNKEKYDLFLKIAMEGGYTDL